jgi:hypothetical protein
MRENKAVRCCCIEDFVALEQGSQSCEEDAISFLKFNAIKIDYNRAL